MKMEAFGRLQNYRQRYTEIPITTVRGPLQKMTGNNQNLSLLNINECIKFVEILSICSKNIERKRNFDINQGP